MFKVIKLQELLQSVNRAWKGLRHGDLADFWPKLSWKLVVANLIYPEHFLWTSIGRYNLNSQRENKPRSLISIILLIWRQEETTWKT